jgi:hypothetical protein
MGTGRLWIMRADSGRRYFFRPINVRHADAAQATVFCIRLYDCTFPEHGVYFLELWYGDVWVVDQRLELSQRGAP